LTLILVIPIFFEVSPLGGTPLKAVGWDLDMPVRKGVHAIGPDILWCGARTH
jgi:hypothetical protein